MSEPENPRWLDQLSGELREEVPVRAAWRARLLAEIARSPVPAVNGPDERLETALGTEDTTATPLSAIPGPRRRIVLHPLAGLAAALAFAAAGAGATLAVMTSRGRDESSSTGAGIVSASPSGPVAAIPSAADGSLEPPVVRFELSAPSAQRVTLVGSFNHWNPAATPLERDPATGKWMVSLRLPAGRHVYAFVVDGDVTADPAAPRAADADFGSPNSVVLVAGRSS